MTAPGAYPSPRSATWTDTAIRVLTGLTVAGLAGVAGAISFSHMRELAETHSQPGWQSFAFPISVDGLEIVASLYLVAQRLDPADNERRRTAAGATGCGRAGP